MVAKSIIYKCQHFLRGFSGFIQTNRDSSLGQFSKLFDVVGNRQGFMNEQQVVSKFA